MSTCHDLVDQSVIPSNFISTTDFYSSSTTKLPTAIPQQQQVTCHVYNNIIQQQQQHQQQYITKGSSVNCTNNNNNTTNCITSFPTITNSTSSTNHLSTSTMNYSTTTTNTTTNVQSIKSNCNLSTATATTSINNTINNNNCNNCNTINSYCNQSKMNNNKQTVQNHTFDTPSDRYQVTDIIGSGTYGVVAICKDSNDQQFALKKNIRVFPDENDLLQANSNNGKYTAFNNSGKLHQLRMLRELKMLHHFRNCPNIVSLKDVYVPNQVNELRDIEMVTSLMEADLRDIFDSGQVLSPKHVKWFMYQICLSVYYMQQAKILHRDLKPENILVNSQCDVAICDFGLARGYYNSNKSSQTTPPSHIIDINNTMNGNTNNMNGNGNTNMNGGMNNGMDDDLSENQTKLSSNYVVSRWYRPPELLTNATQVYNKTLDMWSVGCIMYELLSGKGEVLFKGSGSIDQIQRIIKQLGTPAIEDFNGSEAARDYIYNKFPICKRRSFTKRLPPNTCPMAIDLMKRMLTFNMFKRITPLDALLHPYFREFYDQSDLSVPLGPFDTAWEERMYSSNELKLEAFNTLQNIKRDHYLEENCQAFLQHSEQNDFLPIDDDDQDEYQDLIIDEDDLMMPADHEQVTGCLERCSSSEDQLLNSTYRADQQQQMNQCTDSANQEEDFLMMVVDNYGKLSVDNHQQLSAPTSSLVHHHSSSKLMMMDHDRHFSPTEMNISYQTTRV